MHSGPNEPAHAHVIASHRSRSLLQTMMFYGIDTLVDGAGFDWQRFRTALGARDAE